MPEGATEVASVEGITEFRLSNGLRVLLAPDDSKPTTTVNMTYLVGSRNENYGQTGMAHLLEHMMFKGTATTRNALGEFSRRGLHANGSTSSDRTNYFASFAANPDTLDWYLGWQADAMVNSLIVARRPGLGNDGGAQRNGKRREQPVPHPDAEDAGDAPSSGTTTARTPSARADVENVDIAPAAGVLPRVLPAR